MHLSEYFISGTEKDSERGQFVVIRSHNLDGDVMDIYGQDELDAQKMADKILTMLHAYEWLEDTSRSSPDTAYAVASDVHRGMSLIDAIRKQNG